MLFYLLYHALTLLIQLKTEHVLADATYKIIIEGFPVLTVGTTDKDRHFIPFGCVVSTGEAENDFKFLFDSLKEGLKMIDPSFIYSPKHLIADNAGAIHNGFRKCNILSLVILTCNLSKIIFICKAFNYEAHSGYTRINCWAHCSRLIDNELANVRNNNIRFCMRKDIHC